MIQERINEKMSAAQRAAETSNLKNKARTDALMCAQREVDRVGGDLISLAEKLYEWLIKDL